MNNKHPNSIKPQAAGQPVAGADPAADPPPGPASGSALPALVMWDLSGLSVVVPNRRGTAYLKTPMYHNYVEAIADIENDEHLTDICGLDGWLCLPYGYVSKDEQPKIMERVMPRLAAHYGFKEWREDPAAFWAVLMPNGAG